MQTKLPMLRMTLIAFLMLVALALFPPWATLMGGNGYPRIAFRWVFSTPPPVGGFVYQIDMSRLQKRLAIVVFVFATIAVVNACVRRFRRRKIE